MMRKVLVITIPLFVIFTLGATLLVFNINQPPSWQDEIERYLQYKNISVSGEYEVQNTMTASKPWNFSTDMSKATFGESAYYQTDFRYGAEPPDQDTLDLIPGEAPSSGLIPLPFPPEKLWCVFVENMINGQGRTDLVLAALHQDLYNAEIIIHEAAVGSRGQSMKEIVLSIGCESP